MKQRPSWRRLLYFLGLAIALPLFVRQIWVGYQSVRTGDIELLRPGYLLLALGCTVTMSFIQAVGWVWLMRYLGARLTLRQCLTGYFTSFLPRYIPGSVWGYMSRGAWLEQRYGIGYATSSLGSLLEVGFFVLTTGCITFLAWIAPRPAGVALLFLAILAGIRFGLPPVIRLYARFFIKNQAVPATYRHGWGYAIAGLFLVFWLIYGVAVGATAAAFGDGLRLLPAATAAAQSWLVGLIAVIVPAGLGIRETSLAGLLNGRQGVSVEAAASIAVLSRFALLLAEVLWLAIGLLVARFRRSEAGPHEYTAHNPPE